MDFTTALISYSMWNIYFRANMLRPLAELQVEMNFKAGFYFSTGPLYRPPPLIVDTLLTTESAQGVFRGGSGSRLDADGNCKLVGVARLAPINDWFMDNFLMLPSDCLANMAANITFTL